MHLIKLTFQQTVPRVGDIEAAPQVEVPQLVTQGGDLLESVVRHLWALGHR